MSRQNDWRHKPPKVWHWYDYLYILLWSLLGGVLAAFAMSGSRVLVGQMFR